MDLLRQFGAVDAADNDMTAATDLKALVAALEEQGANPILVLGASRVSQLEVKGSNQEVTVKQRQRRNTNRNRFSS